MDGMASLSDSDALHIFKRLETLALEIQDDSTEGGGPPIKRRAITLTDTSSGLTYFN